MQAARDRGAHCLLNVSLETRSRAAINKLEANCAAVNAGKRAARAAIVSGYILQCDFETARWTLERRVEMQIKLKPFNGLRPFEARRPLQSP